MTVQTSDVILDPYDYDFHEDPYPYYKRLRDEAPLYRNERARSFWALSRHATCCRASATARRCRTSTACRSTRSRAPSTRSRVMSFLALDDPAHLRLRTLVSKGFTPRRIRELEPRVTEIAVQHLDAALQSDSFRLRRRVRGQAADGRHLRTHGRARGRTAPASARWPTASCTATRAVADVPASAIQASARPDGLLRRHGRRSAARSRRDDLTSALLEAEIDGDRLTDEEIMAFLFLMVVAGNETTTKLLANAAYWGYKNPDQLAPVFDDHSMIPPVDRGDAAL